MTTVMGAHGVIGVYASKEEAEKVAEHPYYLTAVESYFIGGEDEPRQDDSDSGCH